MARFADYLDSGYLPGEVWRGAYGEASPASVLTYELGKRFKFKPNSNMAGKFMQEFAQLSDNPNYLIESSMRLPSDFGQAMQYLSSFGGSR